MNVMSLMVRFIPKKDIMEEFEKNYPGFKPNHIDALQAIFILSSELEKALEQYFTKHKFSRARFLLLMVLIHADEKRMTPNEIAKHLNVTPGNMTGLIDCLLKSGFVTKVQDKEDRRQVWIEMTPKANKFLSGILPDYFKRMSQFMSVLKKEELETLISLSRKLVTGLSAFQ